MYKYIHNTYTTHIHNTHTYITHLKINKQSKIEKEGKKVKK